MRKLNRTRRAFAMVLAMMLMALMAAMAVSFASVSSMNVQTAESLHNGDMALVAAESGLSHIVSILTGTAVSGNTSAAILEAAYNELDDALSDYPHLGERELVVVRDGNNDITSISVPSITLTNSQGYSAFLEWSNDKLRVRSTGSYDGVSRTVSISMDASEGGSNFFDYGIASKSAVQMTGNASIVGVNDPSEADMLSATYSTDQAFKLTGNCKIAGDLSTSNPDSYITTAGNVSIGGASGSDIDEHVNIGIGDVDFPEVNPGFFEPYAVNTIDSSTQVTGNKTFENIRIAAGTNPTFGGNITINGVVYIESPNRVKFTGNLNLTGVIVTEDAGDNNFADNYLQFTGNMNTAGVESLPDRPQFAVLKENPGSMLLAPGFEVKFTGNFKTMNGTMAADKYTFTGNAGGQVDGSVICYGDSAFKLTGNSNLKINRDAYSDTPPGFSTSCKLYALRGSYAQ